MMAKRTSMGQRVMATSLFAATALGTGMIAAAAIGLGGLHADYGVALLIVELSTSVALILGGCASTVCALRLADRSWRLMATGLWLYAAGQSTLTYFQLIRHQAISFPSPADAFFLSGMVVIAAALGSFLLDLTRSGFPVELRDQMPRTVAIVLGAGGLVSWIMFRPLFPLQDLDLKTVLALLYPIADVLLLVPVVLLQQATRRFRGGSIWRVWTAMVAGFALLLLGDLSFALMLQGSYPALAAIMNGCYLVGYALVARACLLQLEMLD